MLLYSPIRLISEDLTRNDFLVMV